MLRLALLAAAAGLLLSDKEFRLDCVLDTAKVTVDGAEFSDLPAVATCVDEDSDLERPHL